MNIRAKSYSVEMINQVINCHTLQIQDTLSDHHRAKKTDFPNGLAIDHVFSNGLRHIHTFANQIDFSDHKAILSQFDI